MTQSDTFPCPVCGEDVPDGALACPHCGACDKTGWNKEATAHDGLDLPDEDFDYDEFVENEFGSPAKPSGISWLWWVAGIATAIALLWLVLSATR